MSLHLSTIFLLSVLPWLISCSGQPCAHIRHYALDFTTQSFSQFAAHLNGGPADPLVIELQSRLAAGDGCHSPCLSYLIGSAAAFERVDADALVVIRRLYGSRKIPLMSELLNKLANENGLDTVARFIADNLLLDITGYFGYAVEELIQKNWSIMEKLFAKTLAVAASDKVRCSMCRLALRHFPIEMQYKMINSGDISLDIVGRVYLIREHAPWLKGIFALARCSYDQSPQIRSYIAGRDSYLGQFLPSAAVKVAPPCPDNISPLSADAWLHVSKFVDAETLTFVWPLVCILWRNLHSETLTRSTATHDFYLRDLELVALSEIPRIAPWNYCLSSQKNALKYFGRCIADGALNRVGPSRSLQYRANEYLEAVMENEIPFPKMRDCHSPCDSFLKVLELICGFCTNIGPALRRPKVLTDEEYERIVHHLLYKERKIMALPEFLIVCNMPKLFCILNRDEELMDKLVRNQFRGFNRLSAALVMHGQANGMPEKLAKLAFSQTRLFKGLVEPRLVQPSEYYSFIVESGVILELATEIFQVDQLDRLVISLILFFKNSRSKIDEIIARMNGHLPGFANPTLSQRKLTLGASCSKLLLEKSTDERLPEDTAFIKVIMARCGLLKEAEI